MVVMGMVVVVMDTVMMVMDTVVVVMDMVMTTMVTMIMVALAGRDDDVTMVTAVVTAMVMVVVAMGIVTVTGLSGVHVMWEWSPGHARAPGAGRGETGGTHSVLICGVGHVSGHTPIREVRQMGDLVSPWHLVRAS